MRITETISDNTITKVYELSKLEIAFLKRLNKVKKIEYRNGDYPSHLYDLMHNSFITEDEYAWHFTIILDEYGTRFLEVNNLL
jgi:hypothetical protein